MPEKEEKGGVEEKEDKKRNTFNRWIHDILWTFIFVLTSAGCTECGEETRHLSVCGLKPHQTLNADCQSENMDLLKKKHTC
ncbi:hypothetical protein IRJ41_006721 [Triplophysa rosa]|uniref:Uncharacterized protein n=1 Tax=Triplophysa rosa TaxID=992332 RepID=A0A9W7TTJ6_TRIRA|nr:hypothetical protein IRJ41_006721 [Triplophysa rosa]